MILALNETRKTLIASRIRVVRAPSRPSRALRETIRPGDAVWVEACNRVEISREHGSLDLLFLDSDHRVVAVLTDLECEGGCAEVAAASSLLELAAGTVAFTNTCEGDRIVFEPISAGMTEPRELARRG